MNFISSLSLLKTAEAYYNMEVSRDEAMAAIMLAKMVGRDLANVGSLTTQKSQNINNNVDVNKMLEQLTLAPQPKPDGPVITGASVDGETHEVVLHKVETPPAEQQVEISNPFTKAKPVNTGLSPMAQFLKKPGTVPTVSTVFVAPEQTRQCMPSVSIVTKDIDEWKPDPSKTDDVTLRNILEYLIKIDVKLNKITKQLKKPNEGKISTE